MIEAEVYIKPQVTECRFWYEVTEHFDDLVPRVLYLYGKKGRSRARRLAKFLSQSGGEVSVEGIDITELWANGRCLRKPDNASS